MHQGILFELSVGGLLWYTCQLYGLQLLLGAVSLAKVSYELFVLGGVHKK